MKNLTTGEITPPLNHEEYTRQFNERLEAGAAARANKNQPASAKPSAEPHFGGKPLSYYTNKTDEQILKDPNVRVGEKTLKEIRDAQKESVK
jgi:hypothetical protein